MKQDLENAKNATAGGAAKDWHRQPQRQCSIELTVNGKRIEETIEARMTMVDFLRQELRLTGSHVGCEHGVCGACTILVGQHAVRSCILLAVQTDGHEITTVEGLANGEQLHPLQQAFLEQGAIQCGFCTPGFLLTAVAFLKDNPNPTREQVREALSGSLCRCTGYQGIVDAVMSVAD